MAPTPYPWTLTGYPTPEEGGTPNCLTSNERKMCMNNYLEALDRIRLRFYATGNNPLGVVVTTTLVVLDLNVKHNKDI